MNLSTYKLHNVLARIKHRGLARLEHRYGRVPLLLTPLAAMAVKLYDYRVLAGRRAHRIL